MKMEEKIREKLEAGFDIQNLVIKNQSHLHAGHAGDDGSGESQFLIEIQSQDLAEFSRVEAQRHIYQCLADEMNIIHALSIKVT